MNKKKDESEVIYPSEIIGGKRKKRKTREPKKTFSLPFLRFVARMFDYAIVYLAVYLLEHHLSDKSVVVHDYGIPIQLVIWIPIESCLLTFFNATFGKFLLGLKVRSNRGKLSFKYALSRSFSVWVRGMGLGLFFLPIFTMSYAYTTLTRAGRTSWDRDEQTSVESRQIHPICLMIAIFFILFVFFFIRD